MSYEVQAANGHIIARHLDLAHATGAARLWNLCHPGNPATIYPE